MIAREPASVVGSRLGAYNVLRPLGEGGMGQVFVAEHRLIGRKAALKILNPDLANDPELITRFFNEARAVNDIRHPNIVEVTDFGQFDSLYCIIMELLQGETLAARLNRERVLAEPVAVNIIRQVASGLGAAHDGGLVHRDIKPENIFLCNHPDYPDWVKILDFGIAKLTMSASMAAGNLTKTGSVLGTPTYMSPEQCLGESSLDHRSDIYSVGVVLYQMVTGQTPFQGDTLGRLVVAHVSEAPVPPFAVNPQVSSGLSNVILRALAKKPADRFQTMREMRSALDATTTTRSATPSLARARTLVRETMEQAARNQPPAAPPATSHHLATPNQTRVEVARAPARVEAAAPHRQIPPPPVPRPTPPRPLARPTPPRTETPRQSTRVDSAALSDTLVSIIRDRLAGGHVTLPALPTTIVSCLDLLSDSRLGFGRVANIIESAPSLRQRILRLANSPVFRSAMPASTLEAAVARLGTEGLRTSLLEMAVHDAIEHSGNAKTRERFPQLWTHSLAVGILASELCPLARRPQDASTAYVAGLLHDIAKPVLGALLAEIQIQLRKSSGTRGEIGDAAWHRTIDACQPEVSAAVARSWRLGDVVTRAIEASAGPTQDPSPALSDIVFCANALVLALGLGDGSNTHPVAQGAVEMVAARLGVEHSSINTATFGFRDRVVFVAQIRGQ